MKKCVYCKTALSDEVVLDVCRRCGIGVWGESMYNAILENMGAAKESGNLFQGSVTQSPSSDSVKNSTKKSSTGFGGKSSLVSDAMSQMENTPKEEIKYDSYDKRAA